jgi:tripartite-type tricarboxylate transporter receptor subunit TctC
MNRRQLITGIAVAIVAATSDWALAQQFPSQPLRIIVPFPAGQASDVITRLLADRISPALGQPIIVENRPGAGGNIGSDTGARAANDGYTLTIATAALPISKLVYRKLSFDPLTDFVPVTRLTITPLLLVASPKLGVNSVAELVDFAKKNSGKVSFASSGPGTSHHLSGEMFAALADIKLLHVPYKGSAPAHIDLMSGLVNIMFDNIVAVGPQVRQGNLKALAATTKTRVPTWPDLPTMAEAGYPAFEAVAWFGVLAPKGTPQPVIARLNAEFGKALAIPEIRQKLMEMGAQVSPGTPEEFGKFLSAEVAKWEPVVQRAGVAIE